MEKPHFHCPYATMDALLQQHPDFFLFDLFTLKNVDSKIFSGALIVTTPQKVALADAAKGINMFQKVCRQGQDFLDTQ